MSGERWKNGRTATVVSGLNLESRTIGHNYESVSMDNNFEDVRLTSNTWDTSSCCTSRRTTLLFLLKRNIRDSIFSGRPLLLTSTAIFCFSVYINLFIFRRFKRIFFCAVLLYPHRALFPLFSPWFRHWDLVLKIFIHAFAFRVQVCELKQAIGGERVGKRGGASWKYEWRVTSKRLP